MLSDIRRELAGALGILDQAEGEIAMSFDTLKARLPDYAKDLGLNLSSLAAEPALTEQQRAGTFVASARQSRPL
jgi:hypothetical protein